MRLLRNKRAIRQLEGTGLCAILDDAWGTPHSLVRLAQVLAGAGVRVFQLRVKRLPDAVFHRVAARLRATLPRCALLINDRCDVALATGADGVHLGPEDLPVKAARRLMGARAVIGVSAGMPGELRAVQRENPDYVSVGPVYRTSTKRDAGPPLGWAGFQRLAKGCRGGRPVLAVGGITPDNVGIVVRGGADAVAAAACWWRTTSPGRTAQKFLAAIARARYEKDDGKTVGRLSGARTSMREA